MVEVCPFGDGDLTHLESQALVVGIRNLVTAGE